MQIPVRVLAVIIAVLGTAACNDPTGPSGFEFLIQVRTLAEPDAPSGVIGPARAPGITAIDIDEVVLVFGGFRLEREEDGSDFVLDESVVVPLRLGGEPTLVFAPSVPEGEYRALEVFLDELETEVPAEASLIDVFPRLEGMSVLIAGELTRDGEPEPFLFTSTLGSDVRLDFPRPRTFSADALALPVYSVTFDVARWFDAELDAILDPNDEADRAAIEAAIAESMQVVRITNDR